MLRATPGKRGDTYEITEDGRFVTTFSTGMWRAGATLTVGAGEYTLGADGSRTTMTAADGTVLATAAPSGRTWTVEADGALFRFRHDRLWGRGETVESGGRSVGTVARTNRWSGGGARAELPGLSVPLQFFVLAVVLTMWRRRTALVAARGPMHQ